MPQTLAEPTADDLDEAAADVLAAEDTAELAEGEQAPAETAPEMYRTFTDQVVAPIGSPTDDNRMLASNIDMLFRSMPIPLMWCRQSSGGHDDAFTVGVIESARVEGDKVLASGYLLNTPEADEMAVQNAHGVSNPSVDLAAADYIFTDADGNELDDDAWFDAVFWGEGEYFVTFTKAKLIGTTMVSTPAFDTRIKLDPERSTREVSVVASAQQAFAPKVYDHTLFEDPQLSEITLPTIDEKTGRFYGHIAAFGTCHRSVQDSCTMVPRSTTGYREFHTSPAVRLDNGQKLPVGRLTVGCGHADTRLPGIPAAAHYDNAGAAFALVRVGEDKHGIWFSGVAAPWATPEQIEMGMSAPLSGDWRDFGRGLELVAALAVNTPGFNVRPQGTTDDEGRPFSMVASGRLSPKMRRTGGGARLSKADIKSAVAEAFDEAMTGRERRTKVQELVNRARAAVPPRKTPREQVGEILASRGVGV